MALPPPAEDPLVGRTLLNKLKVVRRIGAGGMGAVYEVEHKVTGHHRALKVLHPGVADGEVLARFAREARVSALVRSSLIVETFDAGATEDGMAYVLMELLDGRPLTRLLAERGRLPPAMAVEIFAQVCDGVAAAHDVGIVHRDLKPDNVFLVPGADGRDRVKLLDFGISKFTSQKSEAFEGTLTSEGALLGTPFYMSPEQMRALKDMDARVDVYALGVMLYEALSGKRPFDAGSFTALVVKIHEGDCEPLGSLVPDVDPSLVAIVARAMHKDRDQRYPSVRELAAALRATQRHDGAGRSEERHSWADSGRMLSTLGGGRTTGPATTIHARSGSRIWIAALGVTALLGVAITLAIGMLIADDDDIDRASSREGRSSRSALVAEGSDAPATPTAPVGPVAAPATPSSDAPPRRNDLPIGADTPPIQVGLADPLAATEDAGSRSRVRPRNTTTSADTTATSRPGVTKLPSPRPPRRTDGPAVDRDDPYR